MGSRFGPTNVAADERGDREFIETIERLQRRLAFEAQVWAGVETEFGLSSDWQVFEDANTNLQEVINFLEEHFPQREGRTPDGRRLICARVCLVLWRKAHGETPYSPGLWDVCELYWQACGNPTTGDNRENWRRYTLQARSPIGSEAPPK